MKVIPKEDVADPRGERVKHFRNLIGEIKKQKLASNQLFKELNSLCKDNVKLLKGMQRQCRKDGVENLKLKKSVGKLDTKVSDLQVKNEVLKAENLELETLLDISECENFAYESLATENQDNISKLEAEIHSMRDKHNRFEEVREKSDKFEILQESWIESCDKMFSSAQEIFSQQVPVESKGVCCICMSSAATYASVNCGHQCVCLSCHSSCPQ